MNIKINGEEGCMLIYLAWCTQASQYHKLACPGSASVVGIPITH